MISCIKCNNQKKKSVKIRLMIPPWDRDVCGGAWGGESADLKGGVVVGFRGSGEIVFLYLEETG